MKNYTKYIVIFIIVCIIAILGIVYISQMNTSFENVVLDKTKGTKINSIDITRTTVKTFEKKEIMVTDENV